MSRNDAIALLEKRIADLEKTYAELRRSRQVSQAKSA